MDELLIEPKMIDFGDNDGNEFQKEKNNIVDKGFKEDEDAWENENTN